MRTRFSNGLVLMAALAVPLACGTEGGSNITAHKSVNRWTTWSEPVNLGAPINSAATEQNSAMSRNGLTLYIQSNRAGTLGGNDLWVSHRASLESAWGEPVNLGSTINTPAAEGGPHLSHNERLLFFQSDRPGGLGDRDIWVSSRANKHDDFGWGPPVNLGPAVNSAGPEFTPALARGGPGRYVLFFQRGVQQTSESDIYQVAVTRDGEPLGTAELVTELSMPGVNDGSPSPRWDGREIIFGSSRAVGGGLFVSTRRSPSDPWSPPVSLGGSFSENASGPELSSDARTLFFFSTRVGGVGGFDIWMSTRAPLTDNDDEDDDHDDRH